MSCVAPAFRYSFSLRVQYADEEKMAFKKPTRLECMMQVTNETLFCQGVVTHYRCCCCCGWVLSSVCCWC